MPDHGHMFVKLSGVMPEPRVKGRKQKGQFEWAFGRNSTEYMGRPRESMAGEEQGKKRGGKK